MEPAHPESVVFVLGAGASVPYGLPTARGLRDAILGTGDPKHRVSLDSYGYERWVEQNVPRDDSEKRAEQRREQEGQQEFVGALRRSGAESIDYFLEHNQKFLDYGKYLIAKAILKRELEAIQNATCVGDWHGWLINRLLRRPNDLFGGRYSFITFNYDRLLESAFRHMLRYRLGLTDDKQLENQMRMIRIVHVYGSLTGSLSPYLKCMSSFPIDVSPDMLNSAASGITIATENHVSTTEKTCQEMVRAASRLVFLGFGFDSINVDRIGAMRIGLATRTSHGMQSGQRVMVFASAYGLRRSERRCVQNLIGDVHLGKPDDGCEAFLRDAIADWI